MHRFYLAKDHFFGNYIMANEKEVISQLTRVLRAKEGERFIVFCGDGLEYVCQLTELSKEQAKFLIIDERHGEREPARFITLYPSLLKSDKFEWLLQKATELGVSRIVPVVSARAVVREISPAKLKRYQEIIREAVEQCGGARIPKLEPVASWRKALSIASAEVGEKYIAWENSAETEIISLGDGVSPIHLFVGPEGGYGEEEIEQAKEKGIMPVSLGKRILRAETAAIVAVARIL
jgi:16S rRNA (uracil1498-N3)-methyltransferase